MINSVTGNDSPAIWSILILLFGLKKMHSTLFISLYSWVVMNSIMRGFMDKVRVISVNLFYGGHNMSLI